MYLSKRFRKKANVDSLLFICSSKPQIDIPHFPVSTPKSTILEPRMHLRMAKFFIVS